MVGIPSCTAFVFLEEEEDVGKRTSAVGRRSVASVATTAK